MTPEQVHHIQDMIEATAPPVAAAFAPTFVSHDKTSASATLRPLPVLVVGGANDKLTPLSHARALARRRNPTPSSSSCPTPGTGPS